MGEHTVNGVPGREVGAGGCCYHGMTKRRIVSLSLCLLDTICCLMAEWVCIDSATSKINGVGLGRLRVGKATRFPV